MYVTAIVLAAGEGTRMKSGHAKVSHQVLGKPMVRWVVDAARAAGCDRVVTVVGSHADEVRALLEGISGVECVEQTERLGTGHAVKVALEAAGIAEGPVVVLNGDLPLIEADTVRTFAESVEGGKAACAILAVDLPDPTGYGRVVTNEAGELVRVVEQKDCTPEEAAITICNAGCYAFDGAALAAHIGELSAENAQGEYYLTDMPEILARAGMATTVFTCKDWREALGVNSRAQLAELTALARDRINARHMAAGVTIMDPASTWIGPEVAIGRDTVILPSCMLMGATTVGEECTVGPFTRLTNVTCGNRVVMDETIGEDVTIDDDVTCGPRCYLRGGAHLMQGSKVGTHVEIKKSTVGRGSKVPHLSYMGDATIGEGVNIGGGSITCNYNGREKNKTVIGDRTFIGSDTMMVAPVTIGSDVVTGASSCITRDVPDGALAIERSQQAIIEGYTARKHAQNTKE